MAYQFTPDFTPRSVSAFPPQPWNRLAPGHTYAADSGDDQEAKICDWGEEIASTNQIIHFAAT